jgi:predicted ATPase
VYIELASLTEPSLVLPTIAKSLDIEDHRGASVTDQLRDRLAAAQMLMVLDNMEQLADAANDLSVLLAATDALLLLVTSRRTLDIRGERIYTLGPLAIPSDGAATAAVELFLDRARSVRPGYQPSDADLATFGELCRRLDGLPLAIELAAAWLRVLSPRALLQRMGYQRLELLREGARDLPSRQRTLRDTIAWSHSLLSADCKLLFARLAVLVGGADLEAIERVTNPEGRLDVLELIAELVDQSLVQALGEAAEPRFEMLETIPSSPSSSWRTDERQRTSAPGHRPITWNWPKAAMRRSAPPVSSSGWTGSAARTTISGRCSAVPYDAEMRRPPCRWASAHQLLVHERQRQ